MRPSGLALALALFLGILSPASAQDRPPSDDGLVSFGLGQISGRGEWPLAGGPGASWASLGLVHLEFRVAGTPLRFQTEVLSFGGAGKPVSDNEARFDLSPSLLPLTLWIAEPFSFLPVLSAGPYLKGEVPSVQDGDTLLFRPRAEAGLKARLSARIPRVGYEPYLEVFGGVSTDRKITAGASVELGALAALVLFLAANQNKTTGTSGP